MVWMLHPETGIDVWHSGDVANTRPEEASMRDVKMMGPDSAKSAFRAHGATAAGVPVFRKKVPRGPFLKFLTQRPCCEGNGRQSVCATT